MEYWLYKSIYSLIRRLPWWLITLLSRATGWLFYTVVRYRRSVVEDNLRQCFPERDETERAGIAKDFYEHLAHQFLASPKMIAAPSEVIAERYMRLDVPSEMIQERQSGARAFIVLMGHIGNWEIFCASNIYLNRYGITLEQLYRPLRNESLDRVQRQMRMMHGAITTPKGDIGRRMVQLMREDKAQHSYAIAFIADQTPSPRYIGLWADFLHRETAFLDGAERLARKYGLPVYYNDITRLSNRQYVGQLIRISDNAANTEPGAITRAYIRMLETTIRRDPAIWLWSHKRWKYTRVDIEKS